MFPVLVVTWVSVATWLFVLTIGFYRDYNENLSHRLEKQQPHIEAFNFICLDAEKIVRMDFADKCHDLRHKLREEPTVYALYDVLETRGLCLGYSCERTFERMGFGSSPLQAVLLVSLIVWLLLFTCGIKMSNFGMDRYSKQYLPHTTHDSNYTSSMPQPPQQSTLASLLSSAYPGTVAPPEYIKKAL
jgi:uncharacterized membrane protein YbjE (DUF340 family)